MIFSSNSARLVVPFLLLSVQFSQVSAESSSLATRQRGVSPAQSKLYISADSHFKCLDGSRTISIGEVNDDYCDCADGSDEPGTSACTNGVFYCLNAPHRPATIPSSRVNDGVCNLDCCDGSDEYGGKISCPNRCKELAEIALAAENELRKKLAEGLRKKKEYIGEAQREQYNWANQVSKLESDLKQLQDELEPAKKARDEAEERERLIAGNNSTDPKDAVIAIRTKLEAIQKHYHSLDDLLLKFKDSKQESDDIKEMLDSSDAMDKEHAEGQSLLDVIEGLHTLEATILENIEKHTNPESQRGAFFTAASRLYSYLPPSVTSFLGSSLRAALSPKNGTKGSQLASDARTKVQDLETKERTIKDGLQNLKTLQERDFGAQMEFYHLNGKCYTLKIKDYTYELCPYGKITQIGGGSGRTSLGTWNAWDGVLPNKYSSMLFSNGNQCWNGPERSVQVTLECGGQEEILSVAEPNKCEYTMRFASPAACTEQQKSDSPPESHHHVHGEL